MEKLVFESDVENEVIEAKFKGLAAERLLNLNILPFDPRDLDLARSEKEIEKCRSIIEKEENKKNLV